jgi:hypothetical protein
LLENNSSTNLTAFPYYLSHLKQERPHIQVNFAGIS